MAKDDLERTTIQVNKGTRRRFKDFCRKSETYDETLNILITFYEDHKP